MMLAAASANALWQLALGAVAVLVVVVAGGVAVQWARGRFHPSARRKDGTMEGAFSMEGLEAMRRNGTIDEQEFRRLRRLALGLGAGDAKSEKTTLSGPEPPDDDTGAARPA